MTAFSRQSSRRRRCLPAESPFACRAAPATTPRFLPPSCLRGCCSYPRLAASVIIGLRTPTTQTSSRAPRCLSKLAGDCSRSECKALVRRTWLFALPARRALFGEGLGSLDIVRRRNHIAHRRIFSLRDHRLRERNVQSLHHRLLRGADRHWTVLTDLARPALGRLHRLSLWHHLIDETEFEPLSRRNPPPRKNHAHRALQADLTRQALQATGERSKPNTRFGKRE